MNKNLTRILTSQSNLSAVFYFHQNSNKFKRIMQSSIVFQDITYCFNAFAFADDSIELSISIQYHVLCYIPLSFDLSDILCWEYM